MCGVTAKLAKLLLFIINIIVWICGAAILGVGIALAVDKSLWQLLANIPGDMNDNLYAASVYMMIGVGSVLFLVGFLGCCGTCKGSVCLLQCYILLVSILIAVEITGAILAIVYKDSELGDMMKDSMKKTIKETYNSDVFSSESVTFLVNSNSTTDNMWNYIQPMMKCCGAYNHTDYDGSKWGYVNADYSIPITCCSGVADMGHGRYNITDSDKKKCMREGEKVNPSDPGQLFNNGCYDALWIWMAEQADIIIGVSVGLGVLQVFGLITSCCMKSRLQDVDD